MALPKSGVELVAEHAAQYIDDLEKVNKANRGIDDSANTAAGGVSRSGDIMQGVFQGIGQAAVGMALEAGKALVDLAGDTLQIAGDFEATLNTFASVTGGALAESGQDLEDFSDLFLDMGAKTQFSAGQAADAAVELARGGLDPATIAAGGLEGALSLAAAGQLELADAADITARQLGVWADDGVTAANVADLLAQAANASTTDVQSLADGMLQAAGTAKTAGLEFDEFVTTMAAIAPNFSSSQEAGTSLKNMLVRLQPSTKAQAAAMAELGLLTEDGASRFYDANGAFIGMDKAAQLLQDSLYGLSESQKTQALTTIFGNDAMNSAVALADLGADGFNEMALAMDSAGTASEQAAALNQGYNFSMEALGGSIETLQIVLGRALLPTLTEFIGITTSAVNVALAFAQGGEGAAEAVETLLGQIDAISPPLGELIRGIQSGQSPLRAFADLLGASDEATDALIDTVEEIAGETLQRLTDTWNNDVLPATAEAERFFTEDLAPILADLAEAFLPALDAALDIAATYWEDILVPSLKTAWSFFTDNILPVLADVAEWLSENLPPAIEATSDFVTETLIPALASAYAFLDKNVVPILKALGDVFMAVVGAAIQSVAGYWEEELGPAFDDMYKAIDTYVIPALDSLGAWLNEATGGFDGINHAVEGTVQFLTDLADVIRHLPNLPKQLTPGSPTPFETGLWGIADATEQVTHDLGRLGIEMSGLGTVTPDAMGGIGSMPIDVTYGGSIGVDLSMRGGLERLIDARIAANATATARSADARQVRRVE